MYNWSDAWLLLSIIHASKQGVATLDKIIAAGDAINHAIFTPAELESGFARLTSGGYIEEHGVAFSPTDKAGPALPKFRLFSRSVLKELETIGKNIGAASATSEQPHANDLRYEGFSKEAFDEAYNKYVKGMRV